tara:strand:+ start:188 stop:817 length:630 start_codon:yes stop_codon:yes gene_type:complete
MLAVLSACQTTEQTRDRVTVFFTEVTFGDNTSLVSEQQLNTRRVRRWQTAPAVAIQGAPSESQRQAVAESVTRISSATGLNVTLTDGSGDIIINFTDEREFVIRKNVAAGCYAHTRRHGDRIRSVEIKIGKRSDPETVWCLDHELMHAFGFFGHSHRLRSVMSASHHEVRLTDWDLMALRILYDPGVTEGDKWADIRPIALKYINREIE